jgi:hypothetical protein
MKYYLQTYANYNSSALVRERTIPTERPNQFMLIYQIPNSIKIRTGVSQTNHAYGHKHIHIATQTGMASLCVYSINSAQNSALYRPYFNN